MREPGARGVVRISVGEEDYYLRFPDGRIERVNGWLRMLWLGAALIFRGYTLKCDD